MMVPEPKSSRKKVYLFGAGRTEGSAEMSDLLGGKGANLAEMARIGLPVPPGFTITTEVCKEFFTRGRCLPDSLGREAGIALGAVEKAAGARFGDAENPLLVSVRSGSRASMPGMMDTILNLGLNDVTVEGLSRRSGDARFAYDSYRRFIQMYAGVVMGVDHGVFEDIIENHKNLNGMSLDTELAAEDWREVIALYKSAIEGELGEQFPQDTGVQLWRAVAAVFGSWDNARAIDYRRFHDIPDSWGTAVSVQAMVFGNMGPTSATGVAFTRNPSTGEKGLYGEFLPNAQGEDVVAGTRTPQPLTEAGRRKVNGKAAPSLESTMSEAFAELVRTCRTLERHYRDLQDIEFTVENGKLWMLQTRSGKRAIEAALRIAVDMAEEGVLTKDEAVLRVDPAALDHLLHPAIDPDAHKKVIAKGLAASPGAAAGEIVFDADTAKEESARGRDVILVRVETSPEDIHGMRAATGILTARGGTTSHAAVVARGMGKPCVTGAGMLRIDAKAGTMTIDDVVFHAGDVVTIDGGTGLVFGGRTRMREPELSGAFGTLMGWADRARRLGVRANAETPREARQARDLGAEGIGLCRTEHMFFDEGRIGIMREMICADDVEGRRAALAKMLPMQRADFAELFRIMAGLPVTIRLLDPPLHEFLPKAEREKRALAEALGIPQAKLEARVTELTEANPMLGFRGCRLAIRYPEIAEMQTRAIIEAAVLVGRESGAPVVPEVMIPLVAFRREFDIVADIVRKTAAAVMAEAGVDIGYTIGTMVELPRAALRAGEIAAGEGGAHFLSFGTNDLTQTALGLSRDDAAPILSNYMEKGVVSRDPFASIDTEGVGELLEIGAERARKAKPGLKVGICGEHGGDPRSVDFFHGLSLDYVSCSPFRVPVARIAAAQAAIRRRQPSGYKGETAFGGAG